MAFVRLLMVVIGVAALLAGLLFTLQGLGIVHWPRSSFMLEDRSWAVRGGVLMVGGALMAWFGRRLR